jgi:hypothetical protein
MDSNYRSRRKIKITNPENFSIKEPKYICLEALHEFKVSGSLQSTQS